MTDEMRRPLCEFSKENSGVTQKQPHQWVLKKFELQVSQGTISNTIKWSSAYLLATLEKDDVKRHKSAKKNYLENVLYEWIVQYQEHVNMTGELIIEKAKEFLKKTYPQDIRVHFLSRLARERFKSRHVIKNYCRFEESGSVDMESMENNLKSIWEKIDKFDMKDVFNMGEPELFFRLQLNHSLATKQLEGKTIQRKTYCC